MANKIIERIGEQEIVAAAKKVVSNANRNAPYTVNVTYGGTLIGAAAFGPAGGVVGAVVGSGVGYLFDEGYLETYDAEPEEHTIDLKD